MLQLEEDAFAFIAAALVLYAVLVGITVRVHLPRNDALKAAVAEGEPDDPAAVRSAFDEATWVRWNWVRVVLNLDRLRPALLGPPPSRRLRWLRCERSPLVECERSPLVEVRAQSLTKERFSPRSAC